MDFLLPGENDPVRLGVRAWIKEHPEPSARDLAHAGFVVPHWPRPWGIDADPLTQLIIDDELRQAGIRRPFNPIGIGWLGPTIIKYGTEEQRDRYLFPMLAGEEIWCQLFSEPSAGSDLVSVTTRADRDGDHYVVSGSKIWTTFAHMSQFGVLLARTSDLNDSYASSSYDDTSYSDVVSRHSGLSYFICPMDADGITVRTIKDMTGHESFNEVFFDDVRIPVANLVGETGDGWRVAKATLGNERVSLSSEGLMWGAGPTVMDIIDLVAGTGNSINPSLRDRLARAYMVEQILRLTRLRVAGKAVAGQERGPEVSIVKALSDAHGKSVMDLAVDIAGAAGMLRDGDPLCGMVGWEQGHGRTWGRKRTLGASDWMSGFLFSPALTIGGGTAEIQRNIIADNVLGLPSGLSRK